jgi:hypothetical protein
MHLVQVCHFSLLMHYPVIRPTSRRNGGERACRQNFLFVYPWVPLKFSVKWLCFSTNRSLSSNLLEFHEYLLADIPHRQNWGVGK